LANFEAKVEWHFFLDMVYVDFVKEFDGVNLCHSKLVTKLQRYGISS